MNRKAFKTAFRALCIILAFLIFTGLFSGCDYSVSVNTEEADTTYIKTVTILPDETESPETTKAAETTSAPETETAGQTVTTSVTEIVTTVPELTTGVPEVTTLKTEVTTTTPEVTTKAPEVTTKKPEVTTNTPEVTTGTPEITTKEAEVTTKSPEATTKTPETTKVPEVTTQTPESTTKTPDITTNVPEVTTKAPEVTTKSPEVTTESPEITTVSPEVTTKEPEVTTAPAETRSEPDFDNPLSYSSFYAYNNLDNYENSSAMKMVYNMIASAALEFQNSNKNCTRKLDYPGTKLSDIIPDYYEDFAVAFEITFDSIQNEEIIVTAWAAFRNDNPLYFWLGNTVIFYNVGNTSHLPVLIDINYAEATVRNAVTQSIYKEAENIYATVKTLDDYNTALTIHNLICTNIDYKTDSSGNADSSADSHSVAGYFKRAGGVCECYAKTFQLLMNLYGIDNMLVVNTSHAFNLMKADDGNWYWVDVTFDDIYGILTVYFCKNDTENIWLGSGYTKPADSTDNTFLGAKGHEILPAGGYDYEYEGKTYMDLGLFYIYELPARSTVQYNTD